MSEIIPTKTPVKRRRYTREIKAKILKDCQELGNSVVNVALQHGVNANLIHKWRRDTGASQKPIGQKLVPLPLPAPRVAAEEVVFKRAAEWK